MYDSLYAGDVPKYKLDVFRPHKHSKNQNQRYFKLKLGKCEPNKPKSKLRFNEDYIKLTSTTTTTTQQTVQASQSAQDDLTDRINYDNMHLYNRIKECNSYLNRNSSDVEKWIEFIQFQDEIMFELNEDDLRTNANDSSKTKASNDLYLTERKLLIVEKALKSNPSCIRLRILKLELLKSTIESNELNEEWKKLAFTYPTNFEIIKNYMKFIITHISYFSVDKLSRFFDRYMEKIVQYQEGHLKSARNETSIADLEKSMLDVLFLYSTILRQCGFVERSISVWQALIEFNFNKPDLLNEQTTLDDWKEYFEIFWSSGESRLGEKQCIGWKNVLSKNQSNRTMNKETSNILKLLNDKENEVVLSSNGDLNKIWFEIELLREKYNWLSGKPHEDFEDTDQIVLFDDISSCLFRFKNAKSYRNSLLYFLCSLNAIKFSHKRSSDLRSNDDLTDKLILDLPNFFLDNEEQFLSSKNVKLFTPKYFTYDQRLKFTISVFHQSMALVENRNLDDYHQLVDHYLNFIIRNVRQLDKEQSRKLFKQILKKPSNCSKISFWKKFVELEIQLNDQTSAKNIFSKILDMLINQQSSQQQFTNQLTTNEALRLIHDFIEFSLRIGNVKHLSLGMINDLRIDDCRKEKEIGEEILMFIYSLINSRTFKSTKELNSPVQLRTLQKISKQFDESFEQVADCTVEHHGDMLDQQVDSVNNLTYLIVIKIYNHYFHWLLDAHQQTESSIKALEQTSILINEQIDKVKSISSKSISNYLVEQLYEKHLDLHLLYLKFNFNQLKPFNQLLHRAIEQFPTNRYFLTLLVNTEQFRFANGQIEKWVNSFLRTFFF